jgi:superkiller protein 3
VNWRHFPEEKPRALSHYNLGVALSMQGRSDDAIASLAKALDIRSDLTRARFHLAREMMVAGRIRESIVEYQRVLDIMPDNDLAKEGLAIARAELSRVDEGDANRRRASETRPTPAARPRSSNGFNVR